MNRSIVEQLRDFVPIRPLTRAEALSIAERQAQRLLQLVGVTEAPIPHRIISDLPRIDVRHISPFPVSGATHWVGGQWAIVLNGAEPITRQRFSLAHELKHILDHPFIHVLYTGEQDPDDRHRWIEQVCDYFAGCLLMPRPLLKKAWTSGDQHLGRLADKFHVSRAAITTRLQQTGLVDPPTRCSGPRRHDRPSGRRPTTYCRDNRSTLATTGGPR